MEDAVKDILLRYYNINSYSSKTLGAYEDYNLHVTSSDGLPGSPAKEYIFKAFTSVDKSFGSFLDLQVEMMQHLYIHGIKTTIPIPTKTGELWGNHQVNNDSNDSEGHFSFVLLEYVPGITLRAAGNPLSLMEKVGKFAGMVDASLKGFSQARRPALNTDIETAWNLPDPNYLKLRLSEYCESNVTNMGEEICQQYLDDVVPLLSKFQRGYIHGDFNDCNIIVKPKNRETMDFQISGLIDYGDVMESYYVYELAILMADLTSASPGHADPLEIMKLLLKGYRQEFKLSDLELLSLRLCICMRLLHYYVLTGDSLKGDPSNPYLQTYLDREGNLNVFKCLYNISEQEFRFIVEIKDCK